MAKTTRKVETSQRRKSMFARGAKGMEIDKQWEDKKKSERSKGSRFRLDPGKKAIIVVLDDALVFYKEHNGTKGKNQYYRETCLDQQVDDEGNSENCPFCENEIPWSAMYIAGTIINCTGFVNDDDKRIAFFKQLLTLKSEAKNEFFEQRRKLIKKRGKDNPLYLTRWEIRRGKNKKSLASGEYFEYKGAFKDKKALVAWLKEKGVDKDDWKEFLTPFDYDEVLAPKSEDEARKFLGLGSDNRPGKRRKDDDIDDDDDDETAIEDDLSLD